jgi:branched-chain amino acid aminotransferase
MALAIYLDGRFVTKREEALVSVFDHGFLYGDGVFEGIRVYGGRIFRMDDHLERLYASARGILLEIPIDRDALHKALVETVRRSGLDEAYVRLIVSRGYGDLGIDPRKCRKASVYIIADKIAVYPKEKYEQGLKIITAATRRQRPDSLNSQIKSLNYLNNILGLQEAIRAGADEAIMLNDSGYVTEATADNIFIVKAGEVLTPPAHLGLLKGITRGVVLDMAGEMGIAAAERVLVMQDVYTADEVFLTGTGAELVPVVEVDGRSIGAGRPGPCFLRLLEAFRERTKWDGTPVRADVGSKARPERGIRTGRSSEASLQ